MNDAIVISMLVMGAAVLIWVLRFPNQAKDEGLVCRACDGGLLNAPGDIAIASGRCPHCGDAAFDD